jgi:PadR family transcriptional regulator, regulatory protein PadR
MSSNQTRMSSPTLKVLGLLLSSGHNELSGAEIGRATKLASGTLYPILFRLEKAGWLQSRWETGDASALGRPRRRLYLVTPLGKQNATAAFKELEPALGKVAWT